MCKIQMHKMKLDYFQRPQIQHAIFSCQIQCMKFSVNIRGPKEEQSILDPRLRLSYFSLFLNWSYRLCTVYFPNCSSKSWSVNQGSLTGWIRGLNRWFIPGCNTARYRQARRARGNKRERHTLDIWLRREGMCRCDDGSFFLDTNVNSKQHFTQ